MLAAGGIRPHDSPLIITNPGNVGNPSNPMERPLAAQR